MTKAKGLQGCGPRKNLRVTSHTLESVGKCEGMNPHTPKTTPTLGDGVPMDFQNFIERFQGSKLNGLWRSLYHWKLLERRCLKWACIAHLDIWNICYGQKKGRELNCQFDSQPEKVGNRPDLLSCRQRVTYRWKALDESYNFVSNRFRSEVYSQSYGVQGRESPGWCDFGIPTWESRERKTIWM
jgi:hypothetical protein